MNDDLKYDIEGRMKTLMIGFIDRFEQSFGYLWGHGKENKNDNQYLFNDKWMELRTELLNYGNNQIRMALSDIRKSERGSRFKYHYQFINPKFKNKEKGE